MPIGWPDDQRHPAETVDTIRSAIWTTSGTVTVWTPAAGKRIRLLAYHYTLSIIGGGGGAGGDVTVQLRMIEQTVAQAIDTARMRIQAPAATAQTIVIDPGLSVIPGVGWRFSAVNHLLQAELTIVENPAGAAWSITGSLTAYGFEE